MSLPFKPRVTRLSGYGLKPVPAVSVKVDLNENPYDFPEDLKEEVWRRIRGRKWSRYPAYPPGALLEALSRRADWPIEGIVVGNGSNELILASLAVTLDPDTVLLAPRPSFEVYRILGSLLSDRVATYDLGDAFAYDADRFREALAGTSARVVLICSPNNPTGSLASEAFVREALSDRDRLVLLDEAYHEFASDNLRRLLPAHENLVIFRTFSKAWGLAGLRIGYLMAHPRAAREIAKAVLPFNLNIVSETCALVALQNAGRLAEAVESLKRSRADLARSLAAIEGVRPYGSESNFILFEVPVSPRELHEAMGRRGVLVRNVSAGHRLDRCLRVTVGTPSENERMLQALREGIREVEGRNADSRSAAGPISSCGSP